MFKKTLKLIFIVCEKSAFFRIPKQQRKEKILNLELLPQIKLNYASDLEKKEISFYFKTRNSNEFKKILLFLQNKLELAESQIEDLYKII